MAIKNAATNCHTAENTSDNAATYRQLLANLCDHSCDDHDISYVHDDYHDYRYPSGHSDADSSSDDCHDPFD